MPTINTRTLSHNTGEVLAEVERSGRPAIVTVRGRPVAALVPLCDEDLEDWVLANAPEYVANMAEAEAEIAAGVRGQSVADVFAELDAEEAEHPSPARPSRRRKAAASSAR